MTYCMLCAAYMTAKPRQFKPFCVSCSTVFRYRASSWALLVWMRDGDDSILQHTSTDNQQAVHAILNDPTKLEIPETP